MMLKYVLKKFLWPSQWRIQDFPEGIQLHSKVRQPFIWQFCDENRMKMKEFGPTGRHGSATASYATPKFT